MCECAVCQKPVDEPENATYVFNGKPLCSYICYEIAQYGMKNKPEAPPSFIDSEWLT